MKKQKSLSSYHWLKKSDLELIDVSIHKQRCNRITPVEHFGNDESSANLADADIVIAGGKGVGSKDNFSMLFKLAELLGGSVAATRYTVDAGWIDYSYQVGQTGLSVRPKLYFAFGISVAIEHIISMRGSCCIVSVNTDADAPIFCASEYKIIDNCDRVLLSLISHFSTEKGRFNYDICRNGKGNHQGQPIYEFSDEQ